MITRIKAQDISLENYWLMFFPAINFFNILIYYHLYILLNGGIGNNNLLIVSVFPWHPVFLPGSISWWISQFHPITGNKLATIPRKKVAYTRTNKKQQVKTAQIVLHLSELNSNWLDFRENYCIIFIYVRLQFEPKL